MGLEFLEASKNLAWTADAPQAHAVSTFMWDWRVGWDSQAC